MGRPRRHRGGDGALTGLPGEFSGPWPEAASRRLANIPFIRAIGLKALPLAPSGEAVTTLDLRPVLALPGRPDLFSDGLVAAAVDQAASVAIWADRGLAFPHATVTLDITFLHPSPGPALTLAARLTGISGGLGHTLVEVRGGDGALTATAMVNFAMGVYPGDAGQSETSAVPDPSRLNGEPIPDLAGADFDAALGLTADEAGALSLPFGPQRVGSRDPVALHGGVIVGGLAAAARARAPADRGLRLSHLSLDYLRSGLARQTRFQAASIAGTRKTSTLRLEARQDDGERLVATGTARFFAG